MKTPDDRERGILRASSVEKAQPAQTELDPLAELIRIVKEEDPFADILAETRSPRSKPKFSGLRPPEPEVDEPAETPLDDRSQLAAKQVAPRDAVPDVENHSPANVQPLRPARIEPVVDFPQRPASAPQREAVRERDEPGMVARIQRQVEPPSPRVAAEDAPATAGPLRPAALSAAEAEKARANELEEAMRKSVNSTLQTMQRSRKGQPATEAENEDKPVGFTNRFRLTPKADGSGAAPTVVKPATRLAAERGAGTPPQAAAPSLDPVDLEQALRQFRETPEDLLHIKSEPQVPVEHVASAVRHHVRPEPASEPAPVRAPRVTPHANPMFDEPRDLDDPAFAAYDSGEFDTYEDEFEDDYAEPIAPKRRRGGLFAAGVLLGLMLLGGGFVYSFGTDFSFSTPTSDDPPVIHADNRPTKIAPDQPGGEDIPHQNKLVYDRVAGNSESAAPEETIVSREEEVIDVERAKEAAVPSDLPPGVTIAQPPTTTTTVRVAPELPQGDQPIQVARADTPADIPSAAPSSQDDPLTPVPRKVKTLTIRPDGTIVESGATETTASLPLQEADQQPEVDLQQPAVEALEGAQLDAPAAAYVPMPSMRPYHQPVRVASAQPDAPLQLTQPQPVATQTVARATTSALPQADSAGGYVVQLAARRSEDQAVGAFNELRSRYSALAGYQPNIQRADLGDRGVYYRVRVGPIADVAQANQLCDDLKAAGMSDCLVRRQ